MWFWPLFIVLIIAMFAHSSAPEGEGLWAALRVCFWAGVAFVAFVFLMPVVAGLLGWSD